MLHLLNWPSGSLEEQMISAIAKFTSSRMLVVALVPLVVLSVAGCSFLFDFVVSGNLKDGIVFELREYDDRTQLFSAIVNEVTVQEFEAEGNWVTDWEISGSQHLRSIRYGQKSRHFRVTIEPIELRIGHKYRAWISAEGGSTLHQFSIDQDGNVQEIDAPAF